MSDWTLLRKGGTPLYIEYGHTFTKNLFGYDSQIRIDQDAEIRLDLTPNLRARNKQGNDYLDARELADGAVANLTLLQLDDERILEGIIRSVKRLPGPPRTWRLTLNLEREWSFEVELELRRPQTISIHCCATATSG
jgi:hypothetical protein